MGFCRHDASCPLDTGCGCFDCYVWVISCQLVFGLHVASLAGVASAFQRTSLWERRRRSQWVRQV